MKKVNSNEFSCFPRSARKKAMVFVDANNFYHCVKSVKQPREIDFLKLGNLLCKIKGFDFIKMQWYASIPDIREDKEAYKKHLGFLVSLEKKGIKVVKRKLQKASKFEIRKKKEKIFNKIRFCQDCKKLFEKFIHLIIQTKKEKGIDVWCAVDMIKYCLINGDCDICILISGDADFVPSLNLIKENGKEVLVASVHKGFSKELRDNFEYFIIKEETLNKCLRNYK